MTDKVDMIYDQVNRLGDKMDKIIDCNTKMKVAGQDRENRIRNLETIAYRQEELMRAHFEDTEKHFNPYYSETYGQKIRRKKAEIGTGVSISSVIAALIMGIMKAAGWI